VQTTESEGNEVMVTYIGMYMRGIQYGAYSGVGVMAGYMCNDAYMSASL
jgi:hypothetical protein